MKKILSTLFLFSFLVVLLTPIIAFADYPACPQCSKPTQMCACGSGGNFPKDALIWCNNGVAWNDVNDCLAASGGTTGDTVGKQQAKAIVSSPAELIARITSIGDWIFTALLVVAGIFLIVSGFFFVTASGNPETVNKARQMLINALIGVAIAVGAKGMVLVIKGILGG